MPQPIWTRSPGGGLCLYNRWPLVRVYSRLKWHLNDARRLGLTPLQRFHSRGPDPRRPITQGADEGVEWIFYISIAAAKWCGRRQFAGHLSRSGGYQKRPSFGSRAGRLLAIAETIWPSQAGGHNWQPMAFSEKTKLVYIPTLEAPMKFLMMPQAYISGVFKVKKPTGLGLPIQVTSPIVIRSRHPGGSQSLGSNQGRGCVDVATHALLGRWCFGNGRRPRCPGISRRFIDFLRFVDWRRSSPSQYRHRNHGGADDLQSQRSAIYRAGIACRVPGIPTGAIGNERENKERLLVLELGGDPVPLPPERKPAKQEPTAVNFRVKELGRQGRGTLSP